MTPTALHRQAYKASVQALTVPVPMGGLNYVSPAKGMDPNDCLIAWNLLGSEYGLRSRLGYREWCTGLDGECRATLPFSGSHQSGSTDKLFQTSSTGIWDVTTSTASPPKLVTFGTTAGESGYGSGCVLSTIAGHFLIYCDEENGAYFWSENSSTWTKVVAGTTQPWVASTFYDVDNQVVASGNVYVVTTAGTSSGSAPTGTGSGITDGSVVWDYVSAAPSNAIGPSLGDQQNGYTGDATQFVHVAVWKNRVWFTEKNSTRAWYMDVNSFLGTATSFDFGPKFSHGGTLVGIYNWSYDGGNGMDTLLVALSTAGDVVIYQGTNPNQASEFGLKGCWFLGGMPSGRQIATDNGGDILVASALGIIPLSKLVIGNPIVDRSIYSTFKIGPLFNTLVSSVAALPGWSLRIHPTDNALLVTVPTAEGQPTVQLAYSFATKGWSRYRDLPIFSAGVWNGQLYFGTNDGRVCINDGYVDDVKLSDSSSWSPVAYSLLTAYQNLGNARNKRIGHVRPNIMAQDSSPVYQAWARFGFDLSEPDPPQAQSGLLSGSLWDVATWDVDTWAGDYSPSSRIMGGAGMGRDMAIAIRGQAISRTVISGFDIHYTEGGLL